MSEKSGNARRDRKCSPLDTKCSAVHILIGRVAKLDKQRRLGDPQSRDNRVSGPSFPGQSLVEFALVLPVVLFLMVVLIELGVIFYVQTVVTNAAWEGARAGATAVHPDRSDQEILQAVRGAAYGINPEQLEVEIQPAQDEYPRNSPYPLPRGENLTVLVRYRLKLSIPAKIIPLSGKAVSIMEYQNP